MFWVVEQNLYNEYGYRALCEILAQRHIPHAFVKVVPLTDKILHMDFDVNGWKDDIMLAPEPDIDTTMPIMACGSIPLGNAATSRGWYPGTFLNENCRFERWLENYGNHLLNFDSVVSTFGNVDYHWDEFFIRPCLDDKSLNGQIITWDEFKKWQQSVPAADELSPLTLGTMVSVSTPKNIIGEYRFFVVDGMVVTGSQYRLNGSKNLTRYFDSSITTFAQKMVDIWQPTRAFCLDVATTAHGPKVLEINCINSAGFYDIDIAKFVMAIENMAF